MATENWEQIYSSYTADERVEERVKLRKALDTNVTSQGRGDANYQVDLKLAESRLQALTRVMQRAGQLPGGETRGMRGGVFDFSGL
jgi:hypothetical protein